MKAEDNEFPHLTFAEVAAPSTPASGLLLVYAKSDGKLYYKNDAGSEVEIGAAGGGGGSFTAYSAYTPALTATTTNPTLGTGSTAAGRYCQVGTGAGSLVEGVANIKFGTSGTNAGSGSYRISLPVNANTTIANRPIGSGWSFQGGTGLITFVVLLVNATTCKLYRTGSSNWEYAHNIPGGWAASDEFAFAFSYEAA